MDYPRNVLLAEDDVQIVEVLSRWFRLREHAPGIIHAPTATEAIYVLQSQPPDMVLLDLGLPDALRFGSADPLGPIDALLRAMPDPSLPLPILIFTGRDDQLRVQALARGAKEWISKNDPVLGDRVLKVIREAWKARQEYDSALQKVRGTSG